jgi:hypothetical protein
MKRNVVIGLQAIAIVALGFMLYRQQRARSLPSQRNVQPTSGQSFQWPDAPTKGNERIFGVKVQFTNTHIRNIKNIPPGWYLDLRHDVPPNPTFEGSIIVGAAALDNASELPQLDIESNFGNEGPVVKEIEYSFIDFTSKNEDERKVKVQAKTP